MAVKTTSWSENKKFNQSNIKALLFTGNPSITIPTDKDICKNVSTVFINTHLNMWLPRTDLVLFMIPAENTVDIS